MNRVSWVPDPVTQQELFVPAWSTADQAVRRAALKRAGALRLIRFSNDWTHPWPLWEPGAERYNVAPEDLGLSAGLGAELRDWHDRWELESVRSCPWSEPGSLRDWEGRGDRLAAALQEQVWDIADVLLMYSATSSIWVDLPHPELP